MTGAGQSDPAPGPLSGLSPTQTTSSTHGEPRHPPLPDSLRSKPAMRALLPSVFAPRENRAHSRCPLSGLEAQASRVASARDAPNLGS